MAFNGTEHFPKQEIIAFIESLGMSFGADVNAYTSFDETVYMLQVPDRQARERWIESPAHSRGLGAQRDVRSRRKSRRSAASSRRNGGSAGARTRGSGRRVSRSS